MPAPPLHDAVEHRHEPRFPFAQYGTRRRQVDRMVRVRILAPIRLDPIVPLLGQQYGIRFQKRLQLLLRKDFRVRVFAPYGGRGKVPPVMGQPQIIGGQVFPGPVEPRKLAKVQVLGRDIIARIVPRIPQRGLARVTDMHRYIHRLRRHPIGHMRRNHDLDGHMSHRAFSAASSARRITSSIS